MTDLDPYQAARKARREQDEYERGFAERTAPYVVPTVTIGRVTYEVIKTDSDETPYELHGPRGARYGLMRNVPRPHMLFMFNLRGFTRGTPDWWFTDKDGRLEWIR